MFAKFVKLLARIMPLLIWCVWFSPALADPLQLAWDAPTTYTDGTPITDLPGYYLYWHDSTGMFQRVDVGHQTTYPLTNLPAGTTYTVEITAYDTAGNESSPSNILIVPISFALDAVASTPVDTPVTFAALVDHTDPDSDPLTITAVSQSTNGTVTITGTTITYTPAATFVGTDSFMYTVTDGQGVSTTAIVTLTVLPNPTSVGTDSVTDTVTDGQGIATTAPVTLPVLPNPTSVGTDSVTDTVTDGQGVATTAPVTLPVLPNSTLSLVAAYSFDEGSGSTVTDASGHGNHGTITGATWTPEGTFGSALVFDGTRASVTIPDAAVLQLTTGMTLEAWVFPTAPPTTWSTVLMKEQPGNLVYVLYAGSPDDRPNAYFNTSTFVDGEQGIGASSALPLNTWSHLAATYDSATLCLYINGTVVASQASTGAIVTSSGALRLGGNDVWGEYFQGRIDEVRIYSRALSASEIQADMDTMIDTRGPVAAYSFDEGSGSTVTDASGHGNHGTITGATWTPEGTFGSALVFDGTRASVTIPDAAVLQLTTGMTLEAWVFPTAPPTTWSTVLMKEQPGDLVYVLYAGSPDDRPNAYFNTSTFVDGEQGIGASSALPLNTWSHLAATYDSATLCLYINGTVVASQASTGAIVTSSGALRLGGNDVWGEYFQGRIDEVRIYSWALSASEIQADMGTPIDLLNSLPPLP